MNVADNTSVDFGTIEDGIISTRTGLIADALPEVQQPVWSENSQTGVSTKNAQLPTSLKQVNGLSDDVPHWYALRVTYGREKKAYDYLIQIMLRHTIRQSKKSRS